MKLQKVRALNQRPASNLSVIVQFLFNRHMPGEFIPGHDYNKGDTVYTISPDGLSIKLWTCNISGSYPNVKEPYWTEFSLGSYIDAKLVNIVKALYNPHPQMYSLGQTSGSYTVSNMGDGLMYLENTPSYLDVFYDGLLVPQKDWEIIDGEIKSLIMPKESKVLLDCYTPSHELARLIRRVSYTTTAEGGKIYLPTKKIHQYVSYGYELFVNGRFIPPDKYTESDVADKLVITPKNNSGFSLSNGDTCVANFMMSVSNNISIVHTVLTKVIEKDMDAYDIDITDSGYINVFQTMSIFINGVHVNSNMFHFSKGFLNVKKKSDYLKKGDTIMVSVMSFIPNEYKYNSVNDEDRRYITESVYTVENNTRLIPIPFMKFNEDLDDFIIFNENGACISSAKWYIDNDYVRYYSHDQGVYIGDTLNFKMIDRNQNTIMRTFILTASEVNQTEFDLPFNSSDYIFKMLFYSAGAYLSPNEYTMEGTHLSLTHDMTLDVDDRLEVIVFKYPGNVGSTTMEYHRIFVDEEICNTFKLDFQFDPAVSSFMIFANTGLYIGEKFYDISDDHILTIKGEEVYEGGWLDIILVQSTEALTSDDNILGLL